MFIRPPFKRVVLATLLGVTCLAHGKLPKPQSRTTSFASQRRPANHAVEDACQAFKKNQSTTLKRRGNMYGLQVTRQTHEVNKELLEILQHEGFCNSANNHGG